MRYQIAAVGKIKHKHLIAGLEYYQKLIKPFAKIEITEVREAGTKTAAKTQELESKSLLKAAKQSYIICLDEKGKSFGSRELADEVSRLESRSVSRISFLIGGAEGHSKDLKEKADLILSLSKLTLNHEMVRLILLEQIYRIETIRAKHPYHRA